MEEKKKTLTIQAAHHILKEGYLLLDEGQLNSRDVLKLICATLGVVRSDIFNQVTDLEYDELEEAFKNEQQSKKEGDTTEIRFEKIMTGLMAFSLPYITEEMFDRYGKYIVFIKPGQTEKDIENAKDLVKSLLIYRIENETDTGKNLTNFGKLNNDISRRG